LTGKKGGREKEGSKEFRLETARGKRKEVAEYK